MDILDYLKTRSRIVDEAMISYLPKDTEMPSSLHKAMRYSLMAGGKRIRPVLCLAACEAVGGDLSAAMPFACALEMIHTYSLIHDDLPAMDNDDLRRGKPTNHKVFGEATAILAGDALLTLAFCVMTEAGSRGAVSSQVMVDVIHDISLSAGSYGMVGGQVVDMESEGSEIDLPTLEFLHTRKTGALLLASVKSGARIGKGSEADIHALARYGECIGLAFQIADDILDIEGSSKETGKDAGSDIRRKKATFPALLGMSESRRRADELSALAAAALTGFGERAEPLRKIADFIIKRRY